ncbi:MAG: hypothetical protein A370_04671 [Clostridium sp. Maddingley MBC34-26]|nr:MAG: hypothetical protein A370_04671 [Clostridium sp. Maddingley MBC34-26]
MMLCIDEIDRGLYNGKSVLFNIIYKKLKKEMIIGERIKDW